MPTAKISQQDMAHILTEHVRLDQRESWERNKGVFNPNWLWVIDSDFTKALMEIADEVCTLGVGANTQHAVDITSWDYYYNFNKKTGYQSIDQELNIKWFKGVVVRGNLDNDTIHVRTMFPKGTLDFA
ncbi:hypothetical protein GCM10009092_38810 [Bowmanella denitrificans]|uniref:Uncharacterized protein n=1 Tax=Bowmanella denitrificans TaxID=366582 RepID=A0ABN0XR79_9ALTE